LDLKWAHSDPLLGNDETKKSSSVDEKYTLEGSSSVGCTANISETLGRDPLNG